MEKTWLSNHAKGGARAVAYNGSCVIISDTNVCVTMYELPSWFGKRKVYDSENHRVRNAVKFARMNVHYSEEM